MFERALGKDRRVSGGDQQDIALAHRHLELLGEVQHHVAARLRAPGLDEAEVPRGNARLAGERQLAQAPALAPFAQQMTDGSAIEHSLTLADERPRGNYPAGKGANMRSPHGAERN